MAHCRPVKCSSPDSVTYGPDLTNLWPLWVSMSLLIVGAVVFGLIYLAKTLQNSFEVSVAFICAGAMKISQTDIEANQAEVPGSNPD